MRAALLVGCSEYTDSRFGQLPASVQDVDALTRVLGDQTIGDFTVDRRFNEPSGEVSEQIEKFFADRRPDDLLLLYFSCHGVLDPRGRLYFVLVTQLMSPGQTGVEQSCRVRLSGCSRSATMSLIGLGPQRGDRHCGDPFR
ncbi:MAG: caspase family protein [Pseudonocardiaceae bacterium]